MQKGESTPQPLLKMPQSYQPEWTTWDVLVTIIFFWILVEQLGPFSSRKWQVWAVSGFSVAEFRRVCMRGCLSPTYSENNLRVFSPIVWFLRGFSCLCYLSLVTELNTFCSWVQLWHWAAVVYAEKGILPHSFQSKDKSQSKMEWLCLVSQTL